MVYILETELPGKKSIYFALTKIYGIGNLNAEIICKKLGFSINYKLSKLTDDQIFKFIKLVETSNLTINNSLKKSKILLAKKLVQIKTYRGIRKLRGLPVRGQRTHTNAKTCRRIR